MSVGEKPHVARSPFSLGIRDLDRRDGVPDDVDTAPIDPFELDRIVGTRL